MLQDSVIFLKTFPPIKRYPCLINIYLKWCYQTSLSGELTIEQIPSVDSTFEFDESKTASNLPLFIPLPCECLSFDINSKMFLKFRSVQMEVKRRTQHTTKINKNLKIDSVKWGQGYRATGTLTYFQCKSKMVQSL